MGKLSKVLKRASKKARKLERKAERKAAKGANVAPGKFVRLAQLPRESRLARARMRGWNDVVHGKPYRESYDTWKKAAQLAYERGRQEASRAKGEASRHGRALDEWGMNERVQGPMYRAVGSIVGERIIQEMRENVRHVA